MTIPKSLWKKIMRFAELADSKDPKYKKTFEKINILIEKELEEEEKCQKK
jgi:hypothetical protein